MNSYTKEFKLTIVKLAESGRPVKELSEEYGVSKSAIRDWCKAYASQGALFLGNGASPVSEEKRRIRELEKQLREVTMERDILKKAVRIFSTSD